MRVPRLQFSFTVTLLTAFALVFALGVGAVVVAFRGIGQEVAEASAERELAQAARVVAARSRALFQPILIAAGTLAEFHPLAAGIAPGQGDVAPLLVLLAAEPAIQAISVGRLDGGLRQVLRAEGLAPGTLPRAAGCEGARFVLRDSAPAVAGGERPEAWICLGADRARIGSATGTAPGGDPRDAPWYRQAHIPGQVQVPPLGDLALMGRPGISTAMRCAVAGCWPSTSRSTASAPSSPRSASPRAPRCS